MKQTCTFHPTRTGHWICPNCNVAFCEECVLKREKGGYEKNAVIHLCPKCNVSVTWAGVSGIIDPFWKRLPKIFLYPFSLQPVLFMIAICVAGMFFSGPGLVNRLISFVIWGAMLKYAFSALKATASGNLRPPPITVETVSDDFGLVLKQMCLFGVVGFVLALAFAKLGVLAGYFLLILLLLSIPAMVILLATTGSFFCALNPMLFIPLMLRIGWGYLGMYLFLILLLGAPAALARLIFPLFPPLLVTFIFLLAKNFYTLMTYHLMGYVLLQYHQEIGYEVHFEQFHDPNEKSRSDQPTDPEAILLREVTPLIREGKLEEAEKTIQQYAAGHGITHPELAERYFNLLKMNKKTTEMLSFAVTYLDILARENKKAKMIEVHTLCCSQEPAFLPSPAALMKLAGWQSTGKVESAIRLYNQMIQKYPEDSLTPRAYFRAAQLFHDRLMKPEQSRRIIQVLLKKYPESDAATLAKGYLAQL